MVKKYTVSVSDELGERIDRWKGEISPSATFQAAMEKKIDEKEGFIKRLKEDETMDQIVERLREQKMEAENTSYLSGKEEGLRWAKAASYSDLRYAGEVFVRDIDVRSIYGDSVLGDYWRECLNGDHSTKPANEHPVYEYENYFPDAADKWLEGWFDAVDAFWEEVSSKL